MSTPDLSAFNFSFDPTLDTWAVSDEPAELDSSEIFLPNVEGRTEFLAPDPDRVPVIENSVRTDDPTYAARPAEERTRELLSQMRPHRATLLGILAACETPMATSVMKEAVERISGRKFSVYTPSNFCTMLEVAGGLARVTAAGEPYTDEVRAPEMVEVDGRAFWRPHHPATGVLADHRSGRHGARRGRSRRTNRAPLRQRARVPPRVQAHSAHGRHR